MPPFQLFLSFLIERLLLDGNNLTELPAEIGDLKELRHLSVRNNQLVGLPTSIQKMNRLELLYFVTCAHNKIMISRSTDCSFSKIKNKLEGQIWKIKWSVVVFALDPSK